MFELRLEPERLTGEIVRFLNEVCAAELCPGLGTPRTSASSQETI